MSLSKELLEEILGDEAYLVDLTGVNHGAKVSRYYICYKPEDGMMEKARKCIDHDWDDVYYLYNKKSVGHLSYCLRCGVPSSFKIGALAMYENQTQVHLFEQMPDTKYTLGEEHPLLIPKGTQGLVIELSESYSIEAIRIFVKGLINIFKSKTNYFKTDAITQSDSSLASEGQ